MKYGNSDTDIQMNEMIESREIVSRILSFGVSQKQILQLIYLFSLELEDVEKMKKLSFFVKELQENPLNSSILNAEELV